MSTRYNFRERELYRQNYRFTNGTYKFNTKEETRPLYTVDTPPPTVSGKLHIGHIFSYTQAEIIARYKRMVGYNVYYPIGFDDNGIPTETLVYKELGDQAKDMDKKTFIDACLKVTLQYREIYQSLWKSLGMSFDRDMSYNTISPFVQEIAQKRFIELYKSGAVIRREFPALRDRANQTTIAQAETEEIERDSFFHDIRFELEGGGEIIIATTRPELLQACVAVVVHPEDTRYRDKIGQRALTPFGEKVPIIADDKVDTEKGSGAVMCCSYGDETDVYRIQKHNLEERIIVGKDGRMKNTGYKELEGLRTHQAREKIIPLLEEKGALVRSLPLKQGILYSERSKAPVEIIPITQRFIDILPIKKELIAYGKEMNFLPSHMQKRYEDRVENLQRNWNISRNRSFGISIPLWYSKKTGEIILPQADQYPVDPLTDLPKTLPEGHTKDDIIGEKMLLDTWFTSGLSPDINKAIMQSHGFKNPPEIFDLRPQAHDIIRTRLLYTTVQSHYKRKQKPFKHIMMSGHVLAKKGEKISKSKGNATLGPEELLEQYGADATRYRSASGQLGKDIAFDESELKNGQKLITKLWNVYQFVKIHLQDLPEKKMLDSEDLLYPTDQRILGRLNETITKVSEAYENYEVGLAKIAFEKFFWHDFCDNYLEIIKQRLYKPESFDNGNQLKYSAQYALGKTFRAILRLLAPIMPHITEEIYQDNFKEVYGYTSLHNALLPTITKQRENIDIKNILKIISDVRGYKTSHKLSLGATIESIEIFGPQDLLNQVKIYEIDVLGVTKTKKISYLPQETYTIKINI